MFYIFISKFWQLLSIPGTSEKEEGGQWEEWRAKQKQVGRGTGVRAGRPLQSTVRTSALTPTRHHRRVCVGKCYDLSSSREVAMSLLCHMSEDKGRRVGSQPILCEREAPQSLLQAMQRGGTFTPLQGLPFVFRMAESQT